MILSVPIFFSLQCSDIYSQRARNRFYQVVEAKILEGVLYVEKCAEFKNQILKKSAGTQKFKVQRNTRG